MAILRRVPRQMYRVYSAEEFADAGMMTDWDGASAREVSRERRFRRLAGAAALTGAVGTVGGAIAFASVGSRSVGLPIAASGTPQVRAAGPPVSPAPLADSVQPTRARRLLLTHQDARVGRSASGNRSAVRPHGRPLTSTRSRSSRRGAGSHTTMEHRARRSPSLAGPIVRNRSATVAVPVPTVPAEIRAQPSTQGEFGFER